MSRTLKSYGGAVGLIRIFGRLAPRSLLSAKQLQRPTGAPLCDPSYCSGLDADSAASEWALLYARVRNYFATGRLNTLRISLDGPPPAPGSWCDGAPEWILDCLDLLGAIEHPAVLEGLSIETLVDRLDVRSNQLIIFLLYVETAWCRPLDLKGLIAVACRPPEESPPTFDWDISELPARATALLSIASGDFPLIDDLRFCTRLEAVCKAGQSVEDALASIAASRSRADPVYQAQLVDGLARAYASTAAEEILDVGTLAVSRCFAPELRERNIELFSARFGLTPPQAATLESIGRRFNMTRERVRQIIESLVSAVSEQSLWAPAVTRAQRAYVEKLPARIRAVEADPDVRSLLGKSLDIAGLDRFALTFLRKESPSAALKQGRVSGVAVTGRQQRLVATSVRNWAVKAVSHVGAAPADWVAGRATRETGTAVSAVDVVSVLEGDCGFEWVHQDSGWFWFRDSGRNRLANRVLKLVCVAQAPIPMETLYGGLVRGDRDKRLSFSKAEPLGSVFLPPILVVQAVCERLPFARVTGHGHVGPSAECPLPHEVLGTFDLTLLRSLKSLGGIARRGELRESVLGRLKISPVTFEVQFSDAPFVINIGRDLYSLRGRELDPIRLAAAVASIDESRRKTPSTGYSSNAWQLTVTEGFMRNYVASVPAHIARQLEPGAYMATGLVEGALHFVDYGSKGMRIRGLRGALPASVVVGDIIRVVADPDNRSLRLDLVPSGGTRFAQPAPAQAHVDGIGRRGDAAAGAG
ncbi:hypothetical protein E4T66_17490 [Sinimarinibacterium sp. CAU 1509]|uniref:hypothetical protein n=1 Tax=Sinimarinibacterium sp. CAU 1509 TaxID=2562283 RepID=UPI0010AC92F4|nr:hypothetical protein [Sinimarinibacterium sp. CAU 1509]TJY57203.1 hypothetical protein E4T66_17490 [Sinimarinibacterium sp. CAU 1509]